MTTGTAEDRYKPSKQIRFKTSVIKVMHILLLKEILHLKRLQSNFIDVRSRLLAFKNNAPSTNCISKINNVLIGNAEDLDVVMSMYNLIKYSKNYRKTTGSLWSYCRDKPNNPPLNDDDPPTVNYNADPITTYESFKYTSTSSITGKTSNENRENSEDTGQGNIERVKKP